MPLRASAIPPTQTTQRVPKRSSKPISVVAAALSARGKVGTEVDVGVASTGEAACGAGVTGGWDWVASCSVCGGAATLGAIVWTREVSVVASWRSNTEILSSRLRSCLPQSDGTDYRDDRKNWRRQ